MPTLEDSHPPPWFTHAVTQPIQMRIVRVGDADVSIRVWGKETAKPPVLFVHGRLANSRWWDAVAPFISEDRLCVAVDLTGHGESDRRRSYLFDGWADELRAVAEEWPGLRRPVVIGHSLGGLLALRAAELHRDSFRSVVAIESPIRELPAHALRGREQRAQSPMTVYPTAEAAVDKFRSDKARRPFEQRWLADHVARLSIRAVDGGWTWKYDSAVLSQGAMRSRALTPVACNTAFIRAERGFVDEQMSERIVAALGGAIPVTAIVASGHNVMLDQPLQLVSALRTILAVWEATECAPHPSLLGKAASRA